jgi:molecular chaperone DnaJ
MSDNFYEILGLARDASAEEIKHAYRTLAREYHPDSQNPRASEMLFRKVSEAYSTLSSSERREKYDSTLGIDSASGDIGKTRSYIFDEIEKEEEEIEEGPRKVQTPKKTVRPQTNTQPVKDSGIVGKLTKLLKIRGDGADVAESVSTYSDPEFMRGERIYKFNIDGLESLTGTSREIALKGDKEQPRMLKVKIPKGSCDGDLLRVKNDKDDEEYLIKLSVSSHEYVVREGHDIILRLPLTIGEALTGTEVMVPTLTEPVKVSNEFD